MRDNKKSGGAMSGRGYYIALVLCAAAIGISGYWYYRNAAEPEPVLQEPNIQATVPVAIMEEDFTVGVTLPQKNIPEQTQKPTEGNKQSMKTTLPLAGETVADYAMDCLSYNQTTRDWRVHDGVDIAAEAGTQVVAAAAGQVYTVFEDDILGTTVVIRHDQGYITTYASLAEELSVSVGDTVELGQVIGTVGETALIETAMGPHVHFSVKCNDEVLDPDEFFRIGS